MYHNFRFVRNQLFFLFLILCNIAVSQNKSISTRQQIDSITDSAWDMLRTEPVLSLELSEQAFEMSKTAQYTDGEINALLLMGMVYKQIGAFDKSAEVYFEALGIAQKTQNQPKISSCYNNIGNVYQIQGNFDKALQYYLLSLDIEEQLRNKAQISIRLYNIGVLYESVDSLNKALTYYYNSLLTEEEINNSEGIIFALYGISGIEIRLGRFESATQNLLRAINLARQSGDKAALVLCVHETGKLHLAMSNYQQAITYLDSGIILAKQLKMNNDLTEMYKDLALAKSGAGNFKEGFTALMNYVKLRDSINNIEIAGKVAEMEARFQVEKKEEEILTLKKINEIKTQKADSEKRNRTFLLITILLVIIISVFNLRRIAPDIGSILLISGGTLLLLILASLVLFVTNKERTILIFLSYFIDVLTYSLPLLFTVLFMAERILFKKYFIQAKEFTKEIQEIPLNETSGLLDLKFEGKDAELNIPVSDFLCFEANDNYINAYFLSGKHVKTELFRSTMKMAEDQLIQYEEIMRCHKSYIINTRHIDHISGNAQGYKIHLKHLDFDIPVSRKFPSSLISSLKRKI
jgi:tetratricopeptide (TPR) repeat protein